MTLLEILERSRTREKRQTLFYRALAAEAELGGHASTAERLNELHADEQHHLSRLTARMLELGETPADLSELERPLVELGGWEDEAREREEDEVAWYEHLLEERGVEMDEDSRAVLKEILSTEIHHRRELGGKWMPASPGREEKGGA